MSSYTCGGDNLVSGAPSGQVALFRAREAWGKPGVLLRSHMGLVQTLIDSLSITPICLHRLALVISSWFSSRAKGKVFLNLMSSDGHRRTLCLFKACALVQTQLLQLDEHTEAKDNIGIPGSATGHAFGQHRNIVLNELNGLS